MNLEILKWCALAAFAAGALTFAYSAGGEAARAELAAYITHAEVLAATKQAEWDAAKRDLEAQVAYARLQVASSAATAQATDADAERRIVEAVAQAKSAPMADDTVTRMNAIIDEANR